jgi:hypothetical protein
LETIATDFPADFVTSALQLRDDAAKARQLANNNTPLWCNSVSNNQFGLGVMGLASFLANAGISYKELSSVCVATTKALSTTPEYNVGDVYDVVRALDAEHSSPATSFLRAIVYAYKQATLALGTSVRAAFCVQPSATGAFESADVNGNVCSPELQPVVGLRKEDGTYTLAKSALLGDQFVKFSPGTETTTCVSFDTYEAVATFWQLLMTSTGLGHSHSMCWYSSEGKDFTQDDLVRFINSPHLHNLYYRLPSYNPEALDKTQVGEGLGASEDLSGVVEALLGGGSSCGVVQTPGAVECACTG